MSLNEKEWKDLNKKDALLKKAASVLSVEEKDLPRVVERFMKEIEEMESKKKRGSS